MIQAITSNPNFHTVVISTGNILSSGNNELGRKTNEVLDGLKLTLQCNETANHVELVDDEDGAATATMVLRATQELNQKLTENERHAISIGAKIFLNKNASGCVVQAVGALLQILKVNHVDNVVLAYHPQQQQQVSNNVDGGGGTIKWSNHSAQAVDELKQLWATLEQFALQKQITQLGISDLDTETLMQLHGAALVPPTIAQINLESCCVVPPALREFCTQNDIQLLTHSDPEVLLPDEQFIIPGYTLDWAVRYQVHVRCRGVLTAKGYILGASKADADDEEEEEEEGETA